MNKPQPFLCSYLGGIDLVESAIVNAIWTDVLNEGELYFQRGNLTNARLETFSPRLTLIPCIFRKVQPSLVTHLARRVESLQIGRGEMTEVKVFSVHVDGAQNTIAAASKYIVHPLVWTGLIGFCTWVIDDMK